jgi:ADP-heptose:LPS heptosyltransferase
LNILVIKLTSLGDVLHATGHIRTLKETFPNCSITVVTADSSYDIFKFNQHVDKVLLFEKDKVKRDWLRHPRWTWSHILSLIQGVRNVQYDLAFDLQGRFKSVIFLYTAKAKQKFVKGRWPFLQFFKKPEIHAIEEMDQVLRMAGIPVTNSDMEIFTSSHEEQVIQALLRRINPEKKRIMVVSPFTRWTTKNWGVEKFKVLLDKFPLDVLMVFTGVRDKKKDIEQLMGEIRYPSMVSLAGELTLLEFAELMKYVQLLVTGDSFAMHLASAFHTPLIALFGPTDEKRIGPVGKHSTVLRSAQLCQRCYRRDYCEKNCISFIEPETVLTEIRSRLGVSAGTPRGVMEDLKSQISK